LREGMEKGKIEVAKEMLEDGVQIETIFKFTKLSVEEIKNSKKYK
jgi:predicted transposase YdaD